VDGAHAETGAMELILAVLAPIGATMTPQDAPGSIRGVVYDRDFDVPLAAAEVLAVESGQKALTGEQGNYVLTPVPPGRYTLVFFKEGYVREVKTDVLVQSARLAEVDAWLTGEFTDMDEFLVQDILGFGAGSEAALLQLRFESPALLDSIGSELMSRAGASDAASALRLVAGASVQDGKFAVIRGLPDRYVSSQMNGVRLPSADEDKRAVELDQFPAAVIESIQVSKTFTPDQQGDASGGAVDLRLKGIPDERLLELRSQLKFNTQVLGEKSFLSYDGGGVGFLGQSGGGNDIQFDNLGSSWDGAVGVSEEDAPGLAGIAGLDGKWSGAYGDRRELDSDWTLGGFVGLYYERESSFFDDARDESWWVETPGAPMTPQSFQGTPSDGDFKTALYRIAQAVQSVQWGGLATVGLESERHALSLTLLYTRVAEDVATLAQDTTGKEYYFPGYDPYDPMGTGHEPGNVSSAPYLRTETIQYTERTTSTVQLHGEHQLGISGFDLGALLEFQEPTFDWTASVSTADLSQPDKRVFGSQWLPASFNPGVPPFVPPFTTIPTWTAYKPDANFNLGNLQRIWKEISEDSTQIALDVKLPFEQWDGHEGYAKTGLFADRVDRRFDQDSFSNFADLAQSFEGDFTDFWSANFPAEDHAVTASDFDVDYDGEQDISAVYAMLDLPLGADVNLVGGARLESTEIGVVNSPEALATWFPPGATGPVALTPGVADVDFEQDDVLPSVGLEYRPGEQVTARASYSRTVARQTFKELSPIIQQEFLGGPIFIGNPELGMSALENWDLRVDYRPYEGGLVSASVFHKDVEEPIEYVQRVIDFTFTTPVNYPEGRLDGLELEVRHDLGRTWRRAEGLSIGANATFIDAEVTLPEADAAEFAGLLLQAPMPQRDMTNAPEHLYNLYLTYDVPGTRTQAGLFYVVQGDTLVAGAGEQDGNLVPNVYALEYDTLNFSLSHVFGERFKLQFQAKNLTNPTIEEVYRSEFIGDDVTRTSYTKGIEYSLGLSAKL
jgi:TonB-dependent receptor